MEAGGVKIAPAIQRVAINKQTEVIIMRKLTYLAVLEPSTDGYGVFFPDLPGCTSFGSTVEEAQENAKEALELHIYGMEQDGETLPTPSKNISKDIVADGIATAVSVFPDVVKNDMDNKRVKTNTTIPLWLKRAAEARNVNYSRILEVSLLDLEDKGQIPTNRKQAL